MRALVLQTADSGLVYTESYPNPSALEPEQIIVNIHAAALNHRDLWITKGQYAGLRYPIILGSDGVGVVAADESGLSQQRVLINPNTAWGSSERVQNKNYHILGLPNNGTLAEQLLTTRDRLHLAPAHLSDSEAAALPLAGLTAYRALFTKANLQKGEKILINGIGGGVALLAMQLALAAGAEVYVTSSDDEKLARAVQLGATAGANYRAPKWQKTFVQQHGEMDVVIDSAGGDGFAALTDVAAAGGRIVFYGGGNGNINNLNPQKIFWKQLSIFGSTMGSDAEFAAMLHFVAQHKIIPIIDSIFDLQDAKAAFERMNSGAQFGKIIVKM